MNVFNLQDRINWQQSCKSWGDGGGRGFGLQRARSEETLRLGSSGADVTALQNAQPAKGFYREVADGIFVSGPEDAVSAFQTSTDLSADVVEVRLLIQSFPYALSKSEQLRAWFIANPNSI